MASVRLQLLGPPVVDVDPSFGSGPERTDYDEAFALLAAALDGETLLSCAAVAQFDGALPRGFRVESIGVHRLVDLGPPTELYRLRHRDSPGIDPALHVLRSGFTLFPSPATALVDRRREIGEILSLLGRSDVRIVTVTGPAGIGKSRVSKHAAAACLPTFRDGIIYVDLSLVGTPEEIPGCLVAAFSVRDSARQRRAPREIARDYLKTRNCLLLIDNFEQLKGGGDYLAQLLGDCLQVKVLITSRTPIGVGMEHEYSLLPLELPKDGIDPSSAAATASVRLFLECAAKYSSVETDDETVFSIARICRRVDGIPLAIELAAPQLKFMNPDELLRRLVRRIGWLEARDSSVPERQRTMESAIRWSYDLLDDDQKRLFGMFSVFAGSWSLEAAESIFGPFFSRAALRGPTEVAAERADMSVVLLMESLAEQNLIVRLSTGRDTRYRMLQSINEFASDCLSDSPAAPQVREYHARYFRSLAQAYSKELHGASMTDCLDNMELDHGNFERAIKWYEEMGETDEVIGFTVSLVWYWYLHGHFADGRRHLERALKPDQGAPASFMVGRGYRALGWMTFVEGNLGKAAEILRHAVTVARDTGDAYGESEALSSLGIAERFRGNSSEALTLFDESLRVARDVGDELLVMYALNWSYASSGGKFSGSPPFAELDEALQLSYKTGDLWSCAHIQNGLGDLYRETGNLPAARTAYEDSLARMEVLNDRWMMAWNYEGLGATACREGRQLAGIRDYRRAFELFQQLGDTGDALYIVERIAHALVELERFFEVTPILAALPALHGRDASDTLDSIDGNAGPLEGTDDAPTIPEDLRAASKHCRETYPAEWRAGRTRSLDSLVSSFTSLTSPRQFAGGDK